MWGNRLLRRCLLLTGTLVMGSSVARAYVDIPVPALPFVSVQATEPLATEPGSNPGAFTISRAGDASGR